MTENELVEVQHRRAGPFHLGSVVLFDRVIDEAIVEILLQKPLSIDELQRAISPAGGGEDSSPVLEGRGSVILGNLPSFGPVIVKCYHRGGLFGRFVRDRYLMMGKTRGQLEYEMLECVNQLGVDAPKGIAFAYSGFPFYRAWLIMSEIIGKRSFALLSTKNEDLCREHIPALISHLSLLIRNRILHIDLHPGNVVLDREGRVFILDFDNAKRVGWSISAVRDYYLRRWRRAVIKHDLPDFLSETVCMGLRKTFEEGA